ncbi:MAG: CDGSH iron-sulfur domain-containing protein [Planctomycetota bacterium]|jgi:CDGSH-type Zn-finger protein
MEKTEISVFANGPLLVKGDLALTDSAGKPYDIEGKPSVALCRCGQSANKPFCDGAHKAAGFESTCSAS